MIEGSEHTRTREESEVASTTLGGDTDPGPTSSETFIMNKRLQRLQGEAQIPLPFSDEQVQIFESLPPFLKKLYKILAKGEYAFWNSAGTAFYIARPQKFATEVLPNFFNHNNLNSFVRQLNVYGFTKNRLDNANHTELLSYRHPHFIINDFDGMLKIRRNAPQPAIRRVTLLPEQEELKTPTPTLLPTKRACIDFERPFTPLFNNESPTPREPVGPTPRKRARGASSERPQNKRGRVKRAKDNEQIIDELSHKLRQVEMERDQLRMELEREHDAVQKWKEKALQTEFTLNSFVKNMAHQFNIQPQNIEARFVETGDLIEENGGDSLVNWGGLRAHTYEQDMRDDGEKRFKIKIVIVESEDVVEQQNLWPLTSQEEVEPEVEFISSSGGGEPARDLSICFVDEPQEYLGGRDVIMSPYGGDESVSVAGGGLLEEPRLGVQASWAWGVGLS